MASQEILQLITSRNALETNPYLSIFSSNETLQNLVDTLQARCEDQERQIYESKEKEAAAALDDPNNNGSSSSSRNEKRLRDKVERLQEQLNEKLQTEVASSASLLNNANELARLKDLASTNESTITHLQTENLNANETIESLSSCIANTEASLSITEQQNSDMKDEIDKLKTENEEFNKLNDMLVGRVVSEKENMMDEFNRMNEMLEEKQKEVDMLRLLQKQQEREKRSSKIISDKLSRMTNTERAEGGGGRRWGGMGTAIPTQPKCVLRAHSSEIISVRYDGSGKDLVATASCDSTVKVWDTNSGKSTATLRTNSNQPMLGVDINGELVAGCCSDKTCRVWKVKTERMIHQLVGHGNKVTCVRLFPDNKGVITGSADRSIKVWDIARNTYRVTTTLRHASSINCIDIMSSIDSQYVISGHVDGGLRFWDVRSSEKTADFASLHEGDISSVQFDPSGGRLVLTNGRDNALKLIDIRMDGTVVQEFRDQGFRTVNNWSSSCFSSDGSYVAAGSGTTGETFVWRVADGKLEKQLSAHKAGVDALAWGSGGKNGQQVATVDREGVLVLWA